MGSLAKAWLRLTQAFKGYINVPNMADKKLGFAENFLLSGVAAGVSKTAAAPIERVKLLVQNQNEMLKLNILDKPYNGVLDCTQRVLRTEGIYPFWRGNLANVLRYFPTQALNFAFKDTVKGCSRLPRTPQQPPSSPQTSPAVVWLVLFP